MEERKYKVRVIAHQLKNNVIAKSGEVVGESQLNGNAEELVRQRFVDLYTEENKKDEPEQKKTEDELKDYTIEELLVFAEDNDFKVDANAKKADLLKSINKQIVERTNK